jgi:preprotein translocase subunit SecE
MVTRTETEVANKSDTFKMLIALAVLVGGIYGFYHFEAEPLLYRVLGLLALVAVALGIVYTTHTGKALVGFARESRAEVRKVVWPTRQETVQTTLMVIMTVILLGIFLWIVDLILLEIVQYLTGRGE